MNDDEPHPHGLASLGQSPGIVEDSLVPDPSSLTVQPFVARFDVAQEEVGVVQHLREVGPRNVSRRVHGRVDTICP